MAQYDHRKNLLSQLHMYLNRYGLMDEKRAMIRAFTVGRTDSARALSIPELRGLVRELRDKDPRERDKGLWTRKLIYEFTQWHQRFCLAENTANMEEINKYVLKHWKKKTVWSFTLEELPRIIAVIQKINRNGKQATRVAPEA